MLAFAPPRDIYHCTAALYYCTAVMGQAYFNLRQDCAIVTSTCRKYEIIRFLYCREIKHRKKTEDLPTR